ncbi:unnamed protein product [Rotaria sp. Silwood1]|nr:unnamed protein product [Rotaria sp. Silwood1]
MFDTEPVGNQPHGYGIGGFYPCAIYVDGFYWPGYYCTGQLVLIPKSYMGGMVPFIMVFQMGIETYYSNGASSSGLTQNNVPNGASSSGLAYDSVPNGASSSGYAYDTPFGARVPNGASSSGLVHNNVPNGASSNGPVDHSFPSIADKTEQQVSYISMF